MLWRHNPGAAFRTFTARQTWYEQSVATLSCFHGHALEPATHSLVTTALHAHPPCLPLFVSQDQVVAGHVHPQAPVPGLAYMQQLKTVLLVRFKRKPYLCPSSAHHAEDAC